MEQNKEKETERENRNNKSKKRIYITISIVLLLVIAIVLIIFLCKGCQNTNTHELVRHEKVEPTCTASGNIAYYECFHCNKKYYDPEGLYQVTDTTLNKLVHNIVYIAQVEPTCTEDGVKAHYTCSLCSKDFEDNAGNIELTSLVINKLEHNFETTLSADQNVHFNKCNRCDKRQNETFHNYYRGICQDSECGYSINEHKDITITIPSGVTTISNMAFASCSSITSINLPSTINSIGNGAFYGTSIASIEIPRSVTNIESAAFMNCSKLKYISFDKTNITLLNAQMFQNCQSLEYVVIPSSVNEINKGFFKSNTQQITIYYTSSKINWENINKHSDTDQEELNNAKVCYYDETKVSDSDTIYWHYVNNVPTINQ